MFNTPINTSSLLFKSLPFNSSTLRSRNIDNKEEIILIAPSAEQISSSTSSSIRKCKCGPCPNQPTQPNLVKKVSKP